MLEELRIGLNPEISEGPEKDGEQLGVWLDGERLGDGRREGVNRFEKARKCLGTQAGWRGAPDLGEDLQIGNGSFDVRRSDWEIFGEEEEEFRIINRENPFYFSSKVGGFDKGEKPTEVRFAMEQRWLILKIEKHLRKALDVWRRLNSRNKRGWFLKIQTQ